MRIKINEQYSEVVEGVSCFELKQEVKRESDIVILNGFPIKDKSAVWSDYISDEENLEAVKTYMHLKVKLLFDPPSSSVVMECTNRMISELEWRLNISADKV